MTTNQIIILACLVLCIIVAYRSNSTILTLILGSIFLYKGYHNHALTTFTKVMSEPFQHKPEIKVVEKMTNNKINIRQKIREEELLMPTIKPVVINNKRDFFEIKKNSIIGPEIKKNITIKPEIKENIIIEPEKEEEPEPESECNKNNCNELIDGDESMAYLNIHRNEPTRVIKGIHEKYSKLVNYFKEEVEDIEKLHWWGNNEY
jgi:hypothetical protein